MYTRTERCINAETRTRHACLLHCLLRKYTYIVFIIQQSITHTHTHTHTRTQNTHKLTHTVRHLDPAVHAGGQHEVRRAREPARRAHALAVPAPREHVRLEHTVHIMLGTVIHTDGKRTLALYTQVGSTVGQFDLDGETTTRPTINKFVKIKTKII